MNRKDGCIKDISKLQLEQKSEIDNYWVEGPDHNDLQATSRFETEM